MRDILLMSILLASVPLILYRPWVGILMWYWVGIMNPHRLTWGFMHDFPIAMMVAAVALTAFIIARDRQSLPFTREVCLLAAMAAWFTLTTYHAWVPDEAWDYWAQFMKILLFTAVTPILIYGRKRVEALILVIVGSLAFYGVKGGVFVLTTGGQGHVLGPSGSFISGNTNLGLALIMVLPLMLVISRQLVAGRMACMPDATWSRAAGLGSYGAFWLTGLAIVFTYSRGALIGLGAIAPFVFMRMRQKIALIIIGIFAVAVVGVTVPDRVIDRAQTIQTYDEDWSAMQRIQAWGVAWNVAVENPATGAGFEMRQMGDERWLSYARFLGEWPNEARAAHSNYFQVLGQHGFVGLGIYLGVLGSVSLSLLRLSRVARKREDTVWIAEYAWAILIGMVGYVVAGLFLDMAYFTLFYAMVAITIVLRREYMLAEHRIGADQTELVAAGSSATERVPLP